MKKFLLSSLMLSLNIMLWSQCLIDYSKFEEIYSEDFNSMAEVQQTWRVGSYSWGNTNDHKEYVVSPTQNKYITYRSSIGNMSVSGGQMHMKNTMLENEEHITICDDVTNFNTCKSYNVKYTHSTMETTFGELFGDVDCDDIVNDGGWMLGLFEVRCKIPSDPMMFTSFWMYGGSEVDIFEVDNYCTSPWNGCGTVFDFRTNISRHSDSYSNTNFFNTNNPNFYDEFHTWSMLWSEDKITFYLDGNEYLTWYGSMDPGGILNCEWRRMKIILTAKPSHRANWPAYYNEFDPNNEFAVDWVKVYKPLNNNYTDIDAVGYKSEILRDDDNSPMNNVKGNTIKDADKIYYQNNSDQLEDYSLNTYDKWVAQNNFTSLPNPIKSDPKVESVNKIYYKGNFNRLYNYYKSGGVWSSANIGSNQELKEYRLSKINTTDEIVYTSLDRSLKHFYWDGSTWQNIFLIHYLEDGKKANENLIVKDDFIFYESRKLNPFWWIRDKHLWAIYKEQTPAGHHFIKHKFPSEILTQGSSFELTNFACSSDGKKLFYIDKNHRIKYHQFIATTKTWQEDISLNNSITNAYDNLIISDNGNQVFYTDFVGHIYNFYKTNGTWHNNAINLNQKVDIADVDFLDLDESTSRSYFTTKYYNSNNIFNPVATGVLSCFEWSPIDGQWHYRSIPVVDNLDNMDYQYGRVKEKLTKNINNEYFYTDQDQNAFRMYKPAQCSNLSYDNNSLINGIGTNKTDAVNITQNFYTNEQLSESNQAPGTGTVVNIDTIPIQYQYSDPQIQPQDVNAIENVYPNTTNGNFTVVLSDSVLQDDGNNRVIQIVKPITNQIIDTRIVPKNQKTINFNINLEGNGNYDIKVIDNDGKRDSKILIKAN